MKMLLITLCSALALSACETYDQHSHHHAAYQSGYPSYASTSGTYYSDTSPYYGSSYYGRRAYVRPYTAYNRSYYGRTYISPRRAYRRGWDY